MTFDTNKYDYTTPSAEAADYLQKWVDRLEADGREANEYQAEYGEYPPEPDYFGPLFEALTDYVLALDEVYGEAIPDDEQVNGSMATAQVIAEIVLMRQLSEAFGGVDLF